MILINLLPHREERRRLRKRAFVMALGASVVAGGIVVGMWTLWLQHLTAQQSERNAFLRGEIAALDAQIKDIATLRAEIDALKARQAAVEDLQLNRNVPVRLLDELVQQTPEGVQLTAVRQTDSLVQVNGLAQSNERVSEFFRNVQNGSQWLSKVELVEIKAVDQTTAPSVPGGVREVRRLYDFALRMQLKQSASPAAAAAASAPRPAASRAT